MNPTPLRQHRTQIAKYGEDLFRICHLEFIRTSELQRQICGAFLFGVVYTHGAIHGLAPPEVHALAVTMLEDVLAYSSNQAGAFSSRLVEASACGPDDSTNAIIHRGIDGHRQLTTGEYVGLRENLLGLFEMLGAPYEFGNE